MMEIPQFTTRAGEVGGPAGVPLSVHAKKRHGNLRLAAVTAFLAVIVAGASIRAADDAGVAALAKELAARGWIVFAGHPAEIDGGQLIQNMQERGQLDLYLVRPDGSGLRNITNTAELHEVGGRFSPDGKRLLYHQLPRETVINHDQWGAPGRLVIADADGANPVVHGAPGEFPWASMSPDWKQIACLSKQHGKIRIFDLATKQLVRELPNQGIFQQLYWSPDGKRLAGTALIVGRPWNVVTVDLETRKFSLLTRAFSCTPDWFQGDSQQVIFSNRNPDLFRRQYDEFGFTILMRAAADGSSRDLIYANAWKHCYYGCTSPDDQYVVFADDPSDEIVVGELRVLRLADAPIIPPALASLKRLYPNAKEGPVFDLKLPNGVPLRGFEPHWTYSEIGARP